MNGVFNTNSENETKALGRAFGETLKDGDVVLFKGEMGAGKTHFTKGIAHALGISEEVTSPTFALVGEYYGRLALFHFDLFRINSYDDLYSIAFFDYAERGGVIVVEWSENIDGLENEFQQFHNVMIEKTGGSGRRIIISDNRKCSNEDSRH